MLWSMIECRRWGSRICEAVGGREMVVWGRVPPVLIEFFFWWSVQIIDFRVHWSLQTGRIGEWHFESRWENWILHEIVGVHVVKYIDIEHFARYTMRKHVGNTE